MGCRSFTTRWLRRAQPDGALYIGGLLQHSPALLALTNPSTNSFRRLVPGYEAPVNLFSPWQPKCGGAHPQYAKSQSLSDSVPPARRDL